MAVDAFLEITDQSGVIKGESKDDTHKELLQIRNFSFGVEATASAATGTGLGAGKATMKVFSFDVDNSTASPTIFKYACKRHPLQERRAVCPKSRRDAEGLLCVEVQGPDHHRL